MDLRWKNLLGCANQTLIMMDAAVGFIGFSFG